VERVNFDVDSDGMPDDWEIKYGLNPFGNDASLDFDDDGISNIDEYLLGSNPTISLSQPEQPTTRLALANRIDFEASEDFTLGPVADQNGWILRWGPGAQIKEAADAPSGSNVLSVDPGGGAQRLLTPMPSEVEFVQFDAQFPVGTSPWDAGHFIVGPARLFMVQDGSAARVWVGTHGSWYDEYLHSETNTCVSFDLESRLTAWHRITMRIDRGSDSRSPSWDLYIDEKLVAYDNYCATDTQSFWQRSDMEVLKVDNRSAQFARVDQYLITTNNPVYVDADSDGMPDAYESLYGLDIGKDDRDDDPDRDMLSNIKEYFLGTSPVIGDSDGDGLTDGWELAYGYNPQVPDDTSADEDADGLDLVLEQLAGTNPRSFDTDEDLLGDGEEVRLGCSPLAADTDDDGLTDFIENKIGTDPSNADTDGDGMPDGWEVENGLDPLSSADATLDGDADGLTNCQEYFSGTSPSAGDTDEDGVFDADDDSDGDQVSNWRELNEFKTNPLLKDSDRDGVDDLEEINAGRDPLTGSDSATWLTQKYSRWEASYGFRYNGAFAGFSSHNASSLDLFGFDPNPNYIYESGTPFNRMEFGQFFYQYTNGTWSNNDPYLANISDVMKGPIIYSIYWSVFSQAYSSLGSSFHQDGVPYAGEITRISASYWTRVKGVETLTKFVLDDESAREQYLQNPAGSQVTDWSAAGPSAYLRLGGYESSTYQVKCPADWNDPVHWVIVFTPEDGDAEKKYYFLSWNPHGGESPEFVLDPDQLNPGVYGNYEAIFYQASLCADLNRDGLIVPPILENSNNPLSDRTADNLLRFWINDDNDIGSWEGNDIPGQPTNKADFNNAVVDSVRDLVDFFPVYLDINQLLTVLPPSASIKYKLKQADGALNFVYTNLTNEYQAAEKRSKAYDYQYKLLMTGFGPSFTQAAGVASTQQITAAGVELNTPFLDGIKDNNWGVVLIEGRVATDKPLRLVVEKDGTEIAEVSLHLKISPVEQMFRHVNVAGSVKEYDGSNITPPFAGLLTNTAEPGNWPDSLTNGKYFVFAHGFNVDAESARGWNAEVFKRLHVLGSKARFVGISWNGSPPSIFPGKYLDYHKAVFQAFQTGELIKDALSFTNGADVTFAAHSLGNIVASHAIQSGGFTPTRYFMIDAASAIEAYSLSDASGQFAKMVEDDWRGYDDAHYNGTRLYASKWHELFPASDNRNAFTWKKQFEAIVLSSGLAYNFYSGQEDVVANGDQITDASLLQSAVEGNIGDVLAGAYSWKLQELVKGAHLSDSLAAAVLERRQGGWSFNPEWYKQRGYTNSGPIMSLRFPSETNEAEVPTEELKTKPFFRRFLEADLMDPDPATASAKAGETKVKYDVLARAIPAMSNAVAANPLPSLGSRNFDMPGDGVAKDSSGNKLTLPTPNNQWRHSDFKVIALPYVYPMYEAMISQGGLK
jgi:hypothetical protein